MAIIRIYEIRKLAKEERAKRLSELKAELSKLMATKAMGGSIENPGRIRLLKKTIARFNTIAREEELGIVRNVEEKAKPEKAEKPEKAKKAKPEKAEPAEPAEVEEVEKAVEAVEEPAAKEEPKPKKTRKPRAKKEAPKE